MINRVNTALAVLLAAVVVLTATSGIDYSKPNLEILPDMKYTPAWEAFAANPNFPNGQTMQPPVPGTIARGELPLYYTATKEDAVRAGEELLNPSSLSAIEAAVDAESESPKAIEAPLTNSAPADAARPPAEATQQNEATRRAALVRERFSASVERGGKTYLTVCISCHGPQGAGDGPVTQRGFPPPPSMLTGKSLQMKDGQLFHILTYGQGSMAPMAAQLSRERRWDVINYVRDLQSKAPPPPEPTPAEADVKVTPETPAAPVLEAQPSTEKPDEQKPESKETAPSPRNELREPSSDKDSPASSDLPETKDGAEEGPANDANDANGRE